MCGPSRSTIAPVNAPVPGPSSTIRPRLFEVHVRDHRLGECARAGVTAPTVRGLAGTG